MTDVATAQEIRGLAIVLDWSTRSIRIRDVVAYDVHENDLTPGTTVWLRAVRPSPAPHKPDPVYGVYDPYDKGPTVKRNRKWYRSEGYATIWPDETAIGATWFARTKAEAKEIVHALLRKMWCALSEEVESAYSFIADAEEIP